MHLASQPRQQLPGRAVHQHRHGRTVCEHVSQPLGGITRIQRHIGSACLQCGQHGHDHLRASLHADRDPRVRLPPPAREDDAPADWPVRSVRGSSPARLHAPPRLPVACGAPAPRTTRECTTGWDTPRTSRSTHTAPAAFHAPPGEFFCGDFHWNARTSLPVQTSSILQYCQSGSQTGDRDRSSGSDSIRALRPIAFTISGRLVSSNAVLPMIFKEVTS